MKLLTHLLFCTARFIKLNAGSHMHLSTNNSQCCITATISVGLVLHCSVSKERQGHMQRSTDSTNIAQSQRRVLALLSMC